MSSADTATIPMAKSLQVLLQDLHLLGDMQPAVVEAVRALIKQRVPAVQEEVKYGGILFTSAVQFCGVFAYKEHVSVEFSHGARIPDASGRLEGQGKGRRHLKLRCVQDITDKGLAEYIPLALQAANTGN
jgi:hypothetical protein